MPSRRRHVLLAAGVGVVGAVLVAGVAFELWLRSLEGATPMRWGWRDPLAAHGQRAAAEVNQLGYRGQRIDYEPDDVVVLLVGDSQVQADACAFDGMPERRLQEHLRLATGRPVRVFTVGALGYGTDQECLALEDYLAAFRADVVVTWVTTGNDLREVMLPIVPVPKPTFWLEDGALQGPTARIGDPVPAGLRIWQRLRTWWQGPLNEYWHRVVLPATNPPLPLDDEPARTDWGVMQPQTSDFRTEFVSVLVQMEPPSPRALYTEDLVHALLHRMREGVHAQGGAFCVLLEQRADFPLPDGLYEADVAGQRHRLRLSRRAYDAGVARMTQGLDVLRVPVTVEPFVAGPGDPHLNAEAVDQLMQDLARALVAKLPAR